MKNKIILLVKRFFPILLAGLLGNQVKAQNAVPLTPPDNAISGNQGPIILKTISGDIFGTLEMPFVKGPVPVVLIIAGSGPTDRNGNSNMGLYTNAYKMLADSLSAHHIASLRYDKRGTAESKAALKSEFDITFDDYVNDAVGLIRMLKIDKRFSKVIVIGHSEGSLLGMISSNREKVNAFVSIAGAGDKIDKIIERQIYAQSPMLAEKATVLLDSLGKGFSVKPTGMLYSLFRPSIQPYMRSWLKYNPQAEIKKLTIPVLIIQGNTDIQVGLLDAEQLKQAKPDAKLEIIDQMNHILKLAPLDNQQNLATYSNANLPIKTQLVKNIVAFILN